MTSSSTGVDKWLRLSGVPFRHIKKSVAKYQFSLVEFVSSGGGRVAIKPDEQQDCYQELYTKIGCLGESALYGIGSNPTEVASYQFAVEICRAYTEYCFNSRLVAKIKWIDLAAPDWSYLKSSELQEIVVIHGISDASDPKRLEQAKDFIRKSSDCTILVVATTVNIVDMIIRKLGLQPTAIWQLSTIRTNIII